MRAELNLLPHPDRVFVQNFCLAVFHFLGASEPCLFSEFFGSSLVSLLIALCRQVKREACRPAGPETDGSSEWKGANFSFFFLFFYYYYSPSPFMFSTCLHLYHAASAAMRDELAISVGPGTAVYSTE